MPAQAAAHMPLRFECLTLVRLAFNIRVSQNCETRRVPCPLTARKATIEGAKNSRLLCKMPLIALKNTANGKAKDRQQRCKRRPFLLLTAFRITRKRQRKVTLT